MASIIKVDDVQDASGNNIIREAADTITIGASGDTITIPSGATITNSGTASGFGGGKIGQVIQVTKLDRESTTSGSYVDIAGVAATITPSATDSKILVQFSGTFGMNSNYAFFARLVQLISGGSDVYPYLGATGLTTTNRGTIGDMANDARDYMNESFTFLDSPATTTATTYRLQWYVESGGTAYLNRSGQDIAVDYHAAVPSSITVMEVLA